MLTSCSVPNFIGVGLAARSPALGVANSVHTRRTLLLVGCAEICAVSWSLPGPPLAGNGSR